MTGYYTFMYENNRYDWLKRRGITDAILEKFRINANGSHSVLGACITIPIHDRAGKFLFNKYRRDPISPIKPKYVYDKGGHVELFGFEFVEWKQEYVLITEGEMDTLVAWSSGIPAVSSTGGAMSFQEDWSYEIHDRTDVYICYDNDDAGAQGMVKTLDFIPRAKIVIIPEVAGGGIKDISDYVERGGDLKELLRTAKAYEGLEDVLEDRKNRLATWQSVRFHDAYIDAYEKKHWRPAVFGKKEGDRTSIENARLVPISDMVRFVAGNAKCIWHEEKSASMHYYAGTNSVYCFGCGKSGDAIDVWRQLKGLSFKEALTQLTGGV